MLCRALQDVHLLFAFFNFLIFHIFSTFELGVIFLSYCGICILEIKWSTHVFWLTQTIGEPSPTNLSMPFSLDGTIISAVLKTSLPFSLCSSWLMRKSLWWWQSWRNWKRYANSCRQEPRLPYRARLLPSRRYQYTTLVCRNHLECMCVNKCKLLTCFVTSLFKLVILNRTDFDFVLFFS